MNENSTKVPLSVSLRMAESILMLRADDERRKLIHDIFIPLHKRAEEMENRLLAAGTGPESAEDVLFQATFSLVENSVKQRLESFRKIALCFERSLAEFEQNDRIRVEVRLFRQ